MITQKAKDSLKAQDECPVCKANWKELDDMLHEGKGEREPGPGAYHATQLPYLQYQIL